MKCPECGNETSRVVDSRPTEENKSIRRRRVCELCGFRFTTYETAMENTMFVVKTNATRQPFNLDKLRKSIINATTKRKITLSQIDAIAHQIEKDCSEQKGDIKTEYIANQVLSALKKVDLVAYVRFSMVYYNFKTYEDFSKFISDLT